jgi:serine protease Do
LIRRTLADTQAATFCIELPNAAQRGMPTPTGTGFFVSADGWFVTAAHVVLDAAKQPRDDLEQAWLMKESRGYGTSSMCQWPLLDWLDEATDLALLKLDFARNQEKDWLTGLTGFPHLTVSRRPLDEGEPVYSFGYPLSEGRIVSHDDNVTIGASRLAPRATSAIVASTLLNDSMAMSDADPLWYVLDKALNFGNSGGPIIATETGHVHAVCSGFRTMAMEQQHLTDPAAGNPIWVAVPSLYGHVASLANPTMLQALDQRGITIADA